MFLGALGKRETSDGIAALDDHENPIVRRRALVIALEAAAIAGVAAAAATIL